MENDGIHIQDNRGQVIVNKGGTQHVSQNNHYGKTDDLNELKQKLAELIEAIKSSNELNEDTKCEYLISLNGAKAVVDSGNHSQGVLKRLTRISKAHKVR